MKARIAWIGCIAALGAAGAGYGGWQLRLRFQAKAAAHAALVVGQPFVVSTRESITEPKGNVRPAMNYTEARGSDGTLYSLSETPGGDFNQLTITKPGVVIKAVPKLRIKTTLYLTDEENASLASARMNPDRGCGYFYSGAPVLANSTGTEKVGENNATHLIRGERKERAALEEVWLSTDYNCVELQLHIEFRDRPGEYTETNRSLVSAARIEPSVSLTSMTDSYEEVGPLERMKRSYAMAGVPMTEKQTKIFTASDEAYKKRKH